jgi:Zn/Cd-binding protein ZinT
MMGEWQAVYVYCSQGTLQKFSTEKMHQMGVTFDDIEGKYKGRLKYWTDISYKKMETVNRALLGGIC